MSNIALPKIDQSIIERKKNIFSKLKKLTAPENFLSHEAEIKPYETDALAAYKQTPLGVILPESTEEVSNILKFCYQENIKVVPRGAGTGLSGGALPLQDALLISLTKFNKILDIDFANKCVVAQPGVTNLSITHAVQHKGFYYAPDPSSQLACSIGGNVAENSGGVHSLKYGTTTNNILGVEIVLMDGTICRLGGKSLDQEGYDMLGLICGSEGLLGVITEVTVKILKKPQAVKAALIGFPTIEDGGNCVSDIIANGIIPAGMEMMDKALIHATDNFVKAGYPRDAESMLIVELLIDVGDAMGANVTNTMCEAVAPMIEELTGGKSLLRILSNYSTKRMASASAVFDKDAVGGENVVDDIILAFQFAENDSYRAVTHNKGVMNGTISVANATGQDSRAIEAAAHAYAAKSGSYRSLTKWAKDADGNLVGDFELPLSVGIVGGVIQHHPIAKICTKILGVSSANELSCIMGAAGLAQNFAAMHALVTEGIQKGHMKLQARKASKN